MAEALGAVTSPAHDASDTANAAAHATALLTMSGVYGRLDEIETRRPL
jgi:hypothetical protein